MLNIMHSNALLILVILIIGVLVFFVCLPINFIPDRLYPILIAVISFCLLFQVFGASRYLIGWDVHAEYFLFESVKSSGYWYSSYADKYNSALSVTILPTIVQAVLAADDTAIFKLMYPAIFSLAPVILYLAYKCILGTKRAFLSAIFFMSYIGYYSAAALIGKQVVAEVILAALILLTLSTSLQSKFLATPLVMMVLLVGLVASHYSTAYVYIFVAFISWILLRALKRRPVATSSIYFVGFILVVAIAWYIYTAGGQAFTGLLQFGTLVYQAFSSGFLDPATRGLLVVTALGVGVRPTPVNRVDLVVHYLVQVFIVAGAVKLWTKRKDKTLSGEFLCYTWVSLCFLLLSVLLPYFSSGINPERVYQIALIFLSPVCVIGGEAIFRIMFRAFATLTTFAGSRALPRFDINLQLASCVIILFLLFNTGLIHEVSGDRPISFSLGSDRLRGSDDITLVSYYYRAIAPEQDVISAQWLAKYMMQGQSVCGDYISKFGVLFSYGHLSPDQGSSYTPLLYPGSLATCPYIYLRYFNQVERYGYEAGVLLPYNMSDIAYLVDDRNIIYSDGGSSVLV